MLFGVLKEEDFTPLPSGRQACLPPARCGKACASSRRPTNAAPAVALMPSCSSMRQGGGRVRRPVSPLGHHGPGFNIKSSTQTHTHTPSPTHTQPQTQQHDNTDYECTKKRYPREREEDTEKEGAIGFAFNETL